MQIETRLSEDKKELTLVLSGKFDYTCHQGFNSSYSSVSPTPEKYILDVNEVTSMDSSALGMLLLLRNHAGGDNAEKSKVTIVNARNEVFKLLSSCKFDELFEIHAA